MRERDMERADVAKLAAQADEAARAAQDYKTQLDQVRKLVLFTNLNSFREIKTMRASREPFLNDKLQGYLL